MAGLTDEQMAQMEATQPKKGLTDAEMSQMEGYHSPGGDSVGARLSDPNRWKAIIGMDSPATQDVVEGMAPMAAPLGAAPAALQALAGFLQKGGLAAGATEVGLNTGMGAAQGAMNSPNDRLGGAMTGGALGGGLALAGQGIGKLMGYLKAAGAKSARMNPAQADAYVSDPSGVKQMSKQLEDPYQTPELQDQAAAAIQASRKALRGQGLQDASRLRQALDGKTVTINPDEYMGHDPEVDAIIHKAKGDQIFNTPASPPPSDPLPTPQASQPTRSIPKTVTGELPPAFSEGNPSGMNAGRQIQVRGDIDRANLSTLNDAGVDPYNIPGPSKLGVPAEVGPYQPGSGAPAGAPDAAQSAFAKGITGEPTPLELQANAANDMKRILQQRSSFQPGTVLDPVQAAKNKQLAALAGNLRSGLETAGGEGVADLNSQMQEGTLVNSALRKGLKSPLSFLSTEAPDRVATLARAENRGAGGLLDFGNKLGAAKTMTANDVGSGVPSWPVKMAGRGALRVGDYAQDLAEGGTTPATQALINGLYQRRK